jgi:hypothetical protein
LPRWKRAYSVVQVDATALERRLPVGYSAALSRDVERLSLEASSRAPIAATAPPSTSFERSTCRTGFPISRATDSVSFEPPARGPKKSKRSTYPSRRNFALHALKVEVSECPATSAGNEGGGVTWGVIPVDRDRDWPLVKTVSLTLIGAAC